MKYQDLFDDWMKNRVITPKTGDRRRKYERPPNSGHPKITKTEGSDATDIKTTIPVVTGEHRAATSAGTICPKCSRNLLEFRHGLAADGDLVCPPSQLSQPLPRQVHPVQQLNGYKYAKDWDVLKIPGCPGRWVVEFTGDLSSEDGKPKAHHVTARKMRANGKYDCMKRRVVQFTQNCRAYEQNIEGVKVVGRLNRKTNEMEQQHQ